MPARRARAAARYGRSQSAAVADGSIRRVPTVEPPNSVLLVVGREEFTPPSTFANQACAATADCLAIGVVSVDDSPTLVYFADGPVRADLLQLGEFTLESEGNLSMRNVYNKEYESIGVTPGPVTVTVWGDDAREPAEIALLVR